MMEISTDPDGRVYVRWAAGGPYTVLDPDGSVSAEHGIGGRQEWIEPPEADERGDYDDGFADGYEEATEQAKIAVASIRALKPSAVETAAR